jgi:hypothetical protein
MQDKNNKQDKWFITFGGPNENFHRAVKRICSEANAFSEFDHIIGYTDKDLVKDAEFWNKHNNFISKSNRGYGYWIWKSYLTKKTLKIMNDNDILVYADAGCQLNPNGRKRLYEYFDIVNQSKYANLSIQIPPYLEKRFTKMDIFEYLDAKQPEILNTGQFIGGVFILRKCQHTINLIDKWYETCCQYHLLDDSPSHYPNDTSFDSTRHDQSIFSVLRKKIGTEMTDFDETWFAPNWETSGANYPIWASRTRN